MADKRTIRERLTSLLRGDPARGRDPHKSADPPSSADAETPLGLEWKTYQARKPELRQSEGQWVVIHGEQILGIRPSYEEALRLGYEQVGYADFLVHQISESEPVQLLPPQPVES